MKVGASVAVIQQNHILLTRRKDFGVWCLPGGWLESGESPAEAARREIREETGVDVRLKRLVGLYAIPDTSAWSNLIVLFAGDPVGGALQAQVNEVAEMRYFPFDGIPENLLWGQRQRIMDAIQGCGGSTVWRQHVPFDPVQERRELYKLRDETGLSGAEFYAQHFGWDAPESDRQEIG